MASWENTLAGRIVSLGCALAFAVIVVPGVRVAHAQFTNPPAFSAPVSGTVGDKPVNVAIVDVNRDGKPDVITPASFTSSVSVVMNNTPYGASSPTLSNPTSFPVGSGPFSVIGVDLNLDGLPDLVVTNENSDNISVLRNIVAPGSANPSFAAAVTFSVGDAPLSVASADFNLDGKPDLVVANFEAGTLSLLRNTTTGLNSITFDPETVINVGAGPMSVAVGDLNLDGRPDIVSANFSAGNLSVLLNSGTPGSGTLSFAGPASLAVSGSPRSVAMADFNSDGRLDVAASDFSGDVVSVLANQIPPGSSSVSFAPFLAVQVGDGPFSVATLDVNLDGRPDLLTANFGSDFVSVVPNTTTVGSSVLSFAGPSLKLVGHAPEAATSADLNLNGLPDLITADGGPNMVSALLNVTAPPVGAPAMGATVTRAMGNGPYSMAAVDLNGDGRPDLVGSNRFENTLSVFLNSTAVGGATPNFSPLPSLVVDPNPTAGPSTILGGDMNLDGKPDLVVAVSISNAVAIHLNKTATGSNGATFLPPVSLPVGDSPFSIGLADVNIDGRLDVIAVNSHANTLSVRMNATQPGSDALSFPNQTVVGAGAHPFDVSTADFNLDGKPDLVITDLGESGLAVPALRVFMNNTPSGDPVASLSAGPVLNTGPVPMSVTAIDINLDGRPDLAATNFGSATVIVFMNTTPPGAPVASFGSGTLIPTGNSPVWLTSGDVNLDGRPDLLVANTQDATVTLLVNTTPPGAGAPSFSDPGAVSVGGGPRSISVADFNLDGKIDLTTANQDAQVAAIKFNTPLGAIQFESAASSAPENASAAIRLVRDGSAGGGPAQVTTSVTGGTATNVSDYTGLPAVVSFADGEITPRNVPLTIQNDGVFEQPETVNLSIGSPSVGLGLGAGTTHVRTITDGQCTPRPSPAVSVAPFSSTAIKATLTAGPNGFAAIRLGDPGQNPSIPTNVSVDIQGGPSGISTAFTYNPPPATNQLILTLNRVSSGQPVTLPMVLTDGCGDWSTFVGGGAAAFSPSGSSSSAGISSSGRPDVAASPGAACASFGSQAAAQAFLRQSPWDPRNMDRSRNGIACEPADGATSMQGPVDRKPVARR